MIVSIQAQYKLKNNIVWVPCAPGQFYLGDKLFITTPKCKKSSKKRTCLGYVKMHGFHGNQEWGCAYEIAYISSATCPRLINMVSN